MKTLHLLSFFVIGFLFLGLGDIYAQDLQEVAKSKPLKISGSFGGHAGFYSAQGIDARRDPFQYLLHANLNIQIYGVSIPFGATYSQQETNFLQPFNQIGISPRYKWATAHLGYRRMTFSPLTLDNHTFLGGGAEVSPTIKENWQIRAGAMYGRFRRAVDAEDAEVRREAISFQRMGYGLKVGVGYKNQSYLDFILFRANDRMESLSQSTIDSLGLSPEENLVLGVSGEVFLWEKLKIKFDMAGSAFAPDSRRDELEENAFNPVFKAVGSPFYAPKEGMQYRQALRTRITYKDETYQGDSYEWGVAYNRIAPDFRSLGTYYFLNDLEDISATGSTSLKKNTIQLSGSFGLQRNNLDDAQDAQNLRFIGSLQYSHAISEYLNIGLTASNFSSSMRVERDLLSDSLNVYQLSQNYGANLNYIFNEEKNPQSLFFNTGFQLANSRDEYRIDENNTTFFNAMAGHSITFKLVGFSLNSSLTYSINSGSGFTNHFFGPNIGATQSLFKRKVRLSYNFSGMANQNDGDFADMIYNHRLTTAVTVLRKHSITLNAGYYDRDNLNGRGKSFSEFTGKVGYRFSF